MKKKILQSVSVLVIILAGGFFSTQNSNAEVSIERVSLASDGTQGNNYSYWTDISADGRYIAFSSEASNLVPDDTNNASDIFVHDRQTRETTRVSVASDGTQTNGSSFWTVISANGRYVEFSSEASNLISGDTNNNYFDVFIHDRQTGETALVSVAYDGTQGNNGSGNSRISADGRYIAFSSGASNFVPDDTNNASDVFIHDRQTGETSRVSVTSDGVQANGGAEGSLSISADSRFVTFSSYATNLVEGDTNNFEDVFIHDRQTGETSRVSVTSDGVQANFASEKPSVSSDGRYIAFYSSAWNLIPAERYQGAYVFIHDRQTGQTDAISQVIKPNYGSGGGDIPSISDDGNFIAFPSLISDLVSDDTNNSRDVFVARNPLLGDDGNPPPSGDVHSPDLPSELKQLDFFEIFENEIALGGEIGKIEAQNKIIFQAKVKDPDNDKVKLQVQIISLDDDQTALKTVTGELTDSDTMASVYATVTSGNYRWRARAIDDHDNYSEWEEFGDNEISETDFDYGFEPHPYGYEFQNNRVAENSLTGGVERKISDLWLKESIVEGSRWDIFRATFDLDGIDEKTQIKLFKNFQLSDDEIFGGSCYGMSVSSLMQYKYSDFIDRNYNDFSVSLEKKNDLTWNLDKIDNKFNNEGKNIGWDGSKVSDSPTLATILSFQLSQYGQAAKDAGKAFSHSPTKILEQLEKDLPAVGTSQGKMYVIGFERKKNEGHAVVPYKVKGDRMYVYDNNQPYKAGDHENSTENLEQPYSRYFEVDRAKDTWKYLMWKDDNGNDVYWPGTSSDSDIELFSIHDLYNGGSLSRPTGTKNGTQTFFLDGDAELLLTDDAGRITGYKDGDYHEEIPGVEPVHISRALPEYEDRPWRQAYYIDNDTKISASVKGVSENKYTLTHFAGMYFAELSDVPITSGVIDTFDFSQDSTQLSFSDDQENKDYNLTFNRNNGGESQTFYSSNTNTVGGATHKYTIDWDNFSEDTTPGTLQIDEESDGTFEKESEIGAEFSDNIAPETSILISGQQGQNNWYKSDAVINLNAHDNEGGVGVENTEYSLNNGVNWNRYENPFTIPEEGIHHIQYRSTDKLGNTEEVKKSEIKIDKTAPEAEVSASVDDIGIEVNGTDSLTSVVVDQKDKTNYLISDEAGNTTRLQFEGDKIRKGKGNSKDERMKRWYENFSFWKRFFSLFGFGKETNSETNAKLKTIQYNDNPVIQLPNNRLHFVWKTSRKELTTLLEQQLEVYGKFRVDGSYNDKKDETKISIHEECKPRNETVKGLRILNMKTSNGILRYGY